MFKNPFSFVKSLQLRFAIHDTFPQEGPNVCIIVNIVRHAIAQCLRRTTTNKCSPPHPPPHPHRDELDLFMPSATKTIAKSISCFLCCTLQLVYPIWTQVRHKNDNSKYWRRFLLKIARLDVISQHTFYHRNWWSSNCASKMLPRNPCLSKHHCLSQLSKNRATSSHFLHFYDTRCLHLRSFPRWKYCHCDHASGWKSSQLFCSILSHIKPSPSFAIPPPPPLLFLITVLIYYHIPFIITPLKLPMIGKYAPKHHLRSRNNHLCHTKLTLSKSHVFFSPRAKRWDGWCRQQ